ncbi:SH3 domain-containing protein [bacterium]|nr:SH3 domain-containing protein [bacterium]
MRKSHITLILCIIFAAVLSVLPALSQQPKPRHAPNALPGVEPQMLTPEYWIGLHDDADTIIMTPEVIERFNEKNRTKKEARISYEGPLYNPILPLELPDTVPGDSLRARLASNADKLFHPEDMYGSRDFYDGRNAIYDDSMKQEIVDRMNMAAIPDVITRRFGTIVNHASVRQYPTDVPGYHDTEIELDRFQITDLCIGNPVAVLHESVDGDFLFVESPIACGWIAAGDIALADRAAIRALVEAPDFLVATAHRVPVYGDPDYKNFSRYFYMSATMPLIRHTESGYIVYMPYRKPDGSLGFTNGYVRPDADVHIGYLPYTKRSIITQMFKLLNTPYGWHGQNNKRDCVGTLRVVFRCTGIVTGRSISSASDHRIPVESSLSVEEKLKKVGDIEGIITIAGSPGHVALYLGKAQNGMPYYMHQGGWGYNDENGEHLIVNRVSINVATHSWFNISQPDVYTVIRP